MQEFEVVDSEQQLSDDIDEFLLQNTLTPKFKDYVVKSFPIGSRYVCDPPVMDTDRDTLILCDVPSLDIPEQALLNEGWTPCGNGEYVEGHFLAFRKGEDNYVLCRDEKYFNRYALAAQVCRALNLSEKADRMKVHEACLNAALGYPGLISWDGIVW